MIQLERHGRRFAFAVAAVLVLVAAAWLIWPRSHTRIERVRQTSGGHEQPSIEVLKVSAAVDSIAWSPDAATLAVQTKPGEAADNKIRAVLLYDVVAGRQRRIIYETSEPIFSVTFWPDGKRLGCAAWGRNGELEVLMWDSMTGGKIGTLLGAPCNGLGEAFTSDALSIAVSPDGRYVAAGTKLVEDGSHSGAHIGGEVCLWDVQTSQLKWSDRLTHTDIVNSVVFSGDGKTLASAGIDKLIRLWDPETGRLKGTLVGAAYDGIMSLAFSPDGTLLASGGNGREDGGTVRIWDVNTGGLRHFIAPALTEFARNSPVRLTFSPDGQTLFAVGSKKDSDTPTWCVHMWEPHSGEDKGILFDRPGHGRAIAVSPDGERLAVGTYQGEIILINLNH